MSAKQPESFSDTDLTRLATILDRSQSDPTLKDTLKKISQAGSRELLDYCTGTMVPTTIHEVRANRINYLLQAQIDLRELEQLAAHLFQVPAATANRLIKVAASRFAYDWNEYVKRAIKDTLESATWETDGRLRITVTSPLLHEWMREQIQTSGQPKMQETNLGGITLLTKETFNFLADLVGAAEPNRA